MADTKISALTDGSPAQSADILPIDRAGANFRLTLANILALPIPASSLPNGLSNANSANQSQVVVAGTWYYITKSDIDFPAALKTGVVVGTVFRWRVTMCKTAAGTAAFSIGIYRGTNGSISDTRDVTQAIGGTGTGVADTLYLDVQIVVTTAGASGAYYWTIAPINRASVSTGFSVPAGTTGVFSGTVSSVNWTTASLKLGLAFMNTTGTPTITVPLVEASAFNLV